MSIIWIARDSDEQTPGAFTIPPKTHSIDGETIYSPAIDDDFDFHEKILETLEDKIVPGECIKYRIELKRVP